MTQAEIQLILDVCHQVDCLVTQDPGTADLEVLEAARLKMNDFLMAKQWVKAESVAEAILLLHAGIQAKSYLSDVLGC